MSNYEQFLETGKFRELKAEEIEVRAAQCGKGWAQLLLYKDARVDMAILDETVGPMNWQRQHSRDNANCIISIWDREKNQWISKEDTGVESNTEKEKGLASDSFKRSGTNWGIGRSLYATPTIFIRIECEEKNGRYQLPKKTKLRVSEYETDNGRPVKIVITDQDGKEYYNYKSPDYKAPKPAEKPKQNYSTMSTGTVKYEPPKPKEATQSAPKEDEFDAGDGVMLPKMFDDDLEESTILPFGDESAGHTPEKPQEAPEEPKQEEPELHEGERIAVVKSATIGKSRSGMDFARITYQYDGTKEEKEQFQPLSSKWGIISIVKTLKEMEVLPNEELDGYAKAEDIEGVTKAIAELNRTKDEKKYVLKVTQNNKGYDVFELKAL